MSRPGNKGRIAIVTKRGGGMRWTLQREKTSAAATDGEIVWFWRSNAGAKFAG